MEDPRVFSDRNCECVVSGTDSPDTLHSVFADRLRSPLCYPVQQHDERRGNGEDQETEGVTLGNIHESERLSGFPSSGTSVQDTHHEKCGRTTITRKELYGSAALGHVVQVLRSGAARSETEAAGDVELF